MGKKVNPIITTKEEAKKIVDGKEKKPEGSKGHVHPVYKNGVKTDKYKAVPPGKNSK